MMTDLIKTTDRPIFVISDLHIGDRGKRDNFSSDNSPRPKELEKFLDYVKSENGKLIIVGDLFEFWQANISLVLTQEDNTKLIERLGQMDATYILGNHDVDLKFFVGKEYLSPSFFQKMQSKPDFYNIAGRTVAFMHGHEVDPANKGDAPGIGRIAAIFGGIAEDYVGTKVGNEDTESLLLRIVELLKQLCITIWTRYLMRKEKLDFDKIMSDLTPGQKPDRADKVALEAVKLRMEKNYDVLIIGHTHKPGWIGKEYYNSGSWATSNNNAIRIDPNGTIIVGEWIDGQLRPFETNPLIHLDAQGAINE